jgi:hypothetical protein
LHHGDAIFTGQITGRVVLKALFIPLIPFCVTLGAPQQRYFPQVSKAAAR